MMTERAVDAIWEEVKTFDPETNIVVVTMHMRDMEDELVAACAAMPWSSTTGLKTSASLIALSNTRNTETKLKGKKVNHLHAEIDIYGIRTFFSLNISGPINLNSPDIVIPIVNLDSSVRGKARVVQFGRG